MLACAIPAPKAHANEPPATLSREKLQNLAKSFVSRIGSKLRQYDSTREQENSAGQALSLIPDGELLLLRPKTGRFVMDAEIGAIKQGSIIYLSLQDVIGRLELSIDYDVTKGVGSGWFLREDWLIRFDLNKKEVVSRGETFQITDSDIYKDGEEIFVSQQALQKWMSIETEPDVPQQYVGIKTPVPYPALARNNREKNVDGRTRIVAPTLPRLEKEEEMADINVVETQQTLRVRRSPEKPTRITHQNVTAAAGELLKHNAYGVAFWDNEQQLSSVRARLSKESENPELLGPLKARSYTVGDTDLPQLPLTGGSSQELGFRVNNNPLKNADFQRTTISGDSLPGWDVELYRDGFLVDRVRVEDDARYEFPEIDLYAGDNMFEVMFYGPQGEIRREEFNIPVNEEFLATQDNTYDVSVSMNDAQTYLKTDGEQDEDIDTPHLVARYNKVFGDTLAYAGMRARQEDGEQKAYFGTGFTDVWNGFVFDGNAAMDEKANSGLELGTRKTIDNWRLSLVGRTNTEEYNPDGAEGGKYNVLANASKSFLTPFNTNLSFNTGAQYQVQHDDTTLSTMRAGLSHQMGRFNVSSTTSYTKTDLGGSGQENPDDRIDNTLAGRVTLGRFYTSAGVNYNVKPDKRVEDYFAQLSYRANSRLTSDLYLEHNPNDDLSEGRLNVNYRADTFRVTPFVSANTDRDMQAGVKLSTTFVDQPGTMLPAMTGQKIMGRGLVSSFVFHDKNGNNIFDKGDEALPDVVVEATNVRRRAETDEKGYSLIDDLPESYVTDIRVDKASLPDPFMIPGFEGVSIFPKAGQMVNLVFPIHLSGEIDGTVSVSSEGTTSGTPVSSVPVKLYPIDGKSTDVIESFAAVDGYYVMSSIPPGQYILAPDAAYARKLHAGAAAPVFVTIGYDGTVLSGKDIVFKDGHVQTPIEYKVYRGKQYDKPFFALQVGSSAKSKLALVLEKLVARRTSAMQKDLAPFPLEDSENLKYLPGKGLMDHYDRCQTMNDSHVPCKLVLYIPGKADPHIKSAQK